MEINGNIFAQKHIKVSEKNHRRVKLKGMHNYKQIVTIPFPENEKVTTLKCAIYYKDRGDNATKLSPGEFSWCDKHQSIVLCMHEKVNRPFFLVESIPREDLKVSTIETLKRRSAPVSCLYAGKARKTKCKISWGTTSATGRDIERQLTIPSKLGLIHSEGNTFLLNNRVIATVEQGNIIPQVDVTTTSGDYLYQRVMSIFQLDTVRDEKGNEFTIKDGHIIKNGEQIGYSDTNETRFNSKASAHDQKIIERMLNLDETLVKVSVKKREIQQALA